LPLESRISSACIDEIFRSMVGPAFLVWLIAR
jgi:hypothetical protein